MLTAQRGTELGDGAMVRAAAVKEMARILDGLEGYVDIEDEVNALRRELKRLAVTDAGARESVHRRQAEGIAAAKAKGVRFGRPSPPLPENFEEARIAWRSGALSLRQAANSCGMPPSSFRTAVQRAEGTVERERSLA